VNIFKKREPVNYSVGFDNSKGLVECYGCGVMVAKGRHKVVPVTFDYFSFASTKKVRNYCCRCAPAYDEKVYLSDYSSVYFKRVQVDVKGDPVGYKKIKAKP
jgi:hypothetical protein